MSEKRYYWLKLFDDFFTSKRIKKLRNLAGGDTYTIIYLKMQLKALKDEGYLYFDGVMDDFAEELALDIDEKTEDVKITIQYLLSVGLLETNNDEVFKLTYMDRLIGSETASAQRVRDFRERQKEQKVLHSNAGVTDVKPICSVDIEKEIEIDKEKDIYIPPISPLKESKPKKTTNTEILQLLDDSQLSDAVKESIRTWLTYKTEQFKFSYKPTGFKAFLTEVYNNEQTLGAESVCQAISLSMGKGYKGIIWDLVKKDQPRSSAYMDAIKNRVNIVDSWT